MRAYGYIATTARRGVSFPHPCPLGSIKQPRKLFIRLIAQLPNDQRILPNPHQQQRIGGELHDLVGVHEIARGEVLGLAKGSFGVFDHHILFALPARFIGDRFAAHRLRQHIGGIKVIDPERLKDTGVGQECPGALPIQTAELVDVLQNRPELQAVSGHQAHCALDGLQPPERGKLIEQEQHRTRRFGGRLFVLQKMILCKTPDNYCKSMALPLTKTACPPIVDPAI
jgi:hypothetical protein